jgi:hypothetical protein
MKKNSSIGKLKLNFMYENIFQGEKFSISNWKAISSNENLFSRENKMKHYLKINKNLNQNHKNSSNWKAYNVSDWFILFLIVW